MLCLKSVAAPDKIISVNFKSAIEIDDFFHRLLQVHPASETFARFFEKYINHPQFSDDLRRRLGHINLENVDLICYAVEQTKLKSLLNRVAGLAYQQDPWQRFRINITLRCLKLSEENIAPLGWLKHDPKDRIQFCTSMFDAVSHMPSSFAEHWVALRKASAIIQEQVVEFLGRTPDMRAILFLKAYAQCEDRPLAQAATAELGKRQDTDVTEFIENLWKHHCLDPDWQKSLLTALRRLYLLPELAV